MRRRRRRTSLVTVCVVLFVLAAWVGACVRELSPDSSQSRAPRWKAPPATLNTTSASALPTPAHGIDSSVHVALGIPRDGDDSDDWLMDKEAFVVSYNARLNAPNWVAWNLDDRYFGSSPRTPRFHSDTTLPKSFYVVKDEDYAGSGYDRGHLCPSADRTRDGAMNKATFVFSNTLPQVRELNAGPWEKLEIHERELAKAGKELYIVAGGIFDRDPRRVGKDPTHRVAVPRASYKIIVVLERGQDFVVPSTPVVAAIMPNEHDVKLRDWTDYQVSIRAIEEATGYDFLSRVPKDIQDVVETRTP